jgi:hypothetical protein
LSSDMQLEKPEDNDIVQRARNIATRTKSVW